MRSIRLMFTGLLLTAVFAVAAFAQTAGGGKLGVIDTRYFDNGKDGILKYSTAMDTLAKEFEADNNAIKTLATRLQSLENEIKTLQEQLEKPNSPIKAEAVNAKIEEYQKLGREIKFKQEDAKARYERREPVLMGPIRQDIGKALQEFADKQGYSLILDVSKIADAGLILALDGKANLTTEFIKFYNARPAAAASTAAK